jgi:transcriptional regulator with XRE-family HTH domain
MPAAPAILQRLKALGLDQKTIAQYLGASPASVSMWCQGKTPFEEPWQTEATILLAVLHEHLTHGGSLATFRHEPGLSLSAGVAQPSGTLRIPPEKGADFFKTQTALQELPPAAQGLASAGSVAKIAGETIGAWAELIDPLTWHPTARELDAMRRTVDYLRTGLTGLLRLSAQTALAEGGDADQAP